MSNKKQIDCELFDKCSSVSDDFGVLVTKITEVENNEKVAMTHRKNTHKKVEELLSKQDEQGEMLKNHLVNFKHHTEAMDKLDSKVDMVQESHTEEKRDQAWMKKFGYGVATLFGGALIWLFAHAAATDKMSAEVNANIKSNTETLKEVKTSFMDVAREFRTLVRETQRERDVLKEKVSRLELNQYKNYRAIQDLQKKSK